MKGNPGTSCSQCSNRMKVMEATIKYEIFESFCYTIGLMLVDALYTFV